MFAGRIDARRVKRTSLGVWSREDVKLNTFSGEKVGTVEIKAKAEARKRALRALRTYGGVGRTGKGEL